MLLKACSYEFVIRLEPLRLIFGGIQKAASSRSAVVYLSARPALRRITTSTRGGATRINSFLLQEITMWKFSLLS